MRQKDSDERDEAVVISAEEFHRLKRHLTGKSQSPPCKPRRIAISISNPGAR